MYSNDYDLAMHSALPNQTIFQTQKCSTTDASDQYAFDQMKCQVMNCTRPSEVTHRLECHENGAGPHQKGGLEMEPARQIFEFSAHRDALHLLQEG